MFARVTRSFASQAVRIRVSDRALNKRDPVRATAKEVMERVITSNQNIFVHGGAAAPLTLLNGLAGFVRENNAVKGLKLHHVHLEGNVGVYDPDMEGHIRGQNMFIGASARKAVQEGRGDFIPVFLHEIPVLYRNGIIPLDVAFVHLSPPDRHGFCSLGVTVIEARAALEHASIVVAQINENMPRTFGDGYIHYSDIDYVVEDSSDVPAIAPEEISEKELKVGAMIAELIEDGSTLQMGIGTIPNACLKALRHHKNLGIHTEMFSDGLLDLIDAGVITGMNKAIVPGKIVSSFVLGSRKLYDFIHENPSVCLLDVALVNNPTIIAKNPKTVAINSCLEIDITGQVCADSLGTRMYSGIGGQVDFMRGAALSPGGKPIMAFLSTTSKGESRIVPTLKEGAGVVTTRAHVHWVVTEYGRVNLFGKNLVDRAKALISIAHPDHREALERAAIERFKHL